MSNLIKPIKEVQAKSHEREIARRKQSDEERKVLEVARREKEVKLLNERLSLIGKTIEAASERGLFQCEVEVPRDDWDYSSINKVYSIQSDDIRGGTKLSINVLQDMGYSVSFHHYPNVFIDSDTREWTSKPCLHQVISWWEPKDD